MPDLRTTPLHQEHVCAGAKIVDFAGWAMPVSYTGIAEEVKAVRTGVGIFDVSHMGEVELLGPGATSTLQRLVTNDVAKVGIGRCIYSPMCNDGGGTVDDLIALRLSETDWLLVVNASRIEADVAWIQSHLLEDTELVDRTAETALIAVQGPSAEAVLTKLVEAPLHAIRRNQWLASSCCGSAARISRTGYTGEDGFEVFLSPKDAPDLWQSLLHEKGVVPCGLGARDVLRLESALCLYGHELSENISPLEADIEWTVKWNKGDFIGKTALTLQKSDGLKRRLTGLQMCERAVPREGYKVFGSQRMIGVVSSGTFSTTLGEGIALAFIKPAFAEVGRDVDVEIRNALKPANIVTTPFYSHRKEIKDEP